MRNTPEETGTTTDTPMRRPEIARPAFQPQQHPASTVNVGSRERAIGAAVGAALALWGIKRHGLLHKLLWTGLGGALLYRSTTGYCPAYGVLGISTAQDRPASPEQYFSRGVHVEKSYLIHRPATELYHFWRDFSNLPQFMTHLISVEPLSDTRSRWTAKAPFGRKVSWEAEIIHDSPNELISWKSVENSAVANVGTVLFIPHGGGGDGRAEGLTEVRVVLDYIPPAGTLGKIIAELFGEEPAQTVQEGLRRFKRMAEAGSLAHAK